MPTYTVIRDASVIEEGVFDVDPVVDTANPFGDYAVVKMDDRGGQKFEEYERGTRIDIEISPDDDVLNISSGETVSTASGTTDTYGTVNNAGTYENQGTVEATASGVDKFTGYVVERRETEQSGADVLEVEAYTFDQFLRRNTVSNDQTGNLISEALADIIQNDTPVTYVGGNVSVADDQELTRGYQGEPVENVLRDLAFKSGNEDFGVNDALEFFFQPRESTHIDRGIDNTQWFNYDIPELGKEAINEVEVWFDDGEESVIVDDGTDKLDLQDSLDLPEPGTQRAELNRPFLTDINDAEDVGRKYLTFRNSTLSGTVTTFGLFDAQPGDTIDITIDPRGIDTEFVIAATEYRWGRDQTILTIVEKRGDVDDILTDLNDSVQRQEMESANRDAPKNRITTTEATAIVSVDVDADGTAADADRFVNDGRRLVRNAWTGKSYSAISTITVGDDNSGLSRSNTSLVNQTNSASTSQFSPDAKSVLFQADITQTGVEEIGIEAADGTLIARATFDTPTDIDGTISITLTVSNDDSISRGVLTDNGQTAVRDVLASTSPALPNAYAYGSDDTLPTEGDTALGNELVDVSLDEILIQNADTQTQWNSVLGTIPDDFPLVVDSTGPRVAQSSWTEEGESGTSFTAVFAEASNGEATDLDNGEAATFTFESEYDVPNADTNVAVRVLGDGTDAPDHRWILNGVNLGVYSPSTTNSWTWETDLRSAATNDPDVTINEGTNTLEIQAVSSGADNFHVDVVQPHDDGSRFSFGPFTYTYDNDNGGSSGYLDGPELFPDVVERAFNTAATRRDVTQAKFILNANNDSNNFYVELANDGSTFTRVNNSETGSITFAGGDRGVDTRVGLGRYGSRTGATPLTGHLGQQADSWELTANPDAVIADNIGKTTTRAVVPPGTITGETVREAGLKSDSVLLTHHVLADFDVLSGQRIASAETTTFTSDN